MTVREYVLFSSPEMARMVFGYVRTEAFRDEATDAEGVLTSAASLAFPAPVAVPRGSFRDEATDAEGVLTSTASLVSPATVAVPRGSLEHPSRHKQAAAATNTYTQRNMTVPQRYPALSQFPVTLICDCSIRLLR
jgi:fermentation-respiration switch protein FrsA (DUF1100 family)